MPAVVVVCCAVLLAIHGLRLFLGSESDNLLVALFALIPARLTLALHLAPDALVRSYRATVEHSPIVAAQIDFLLGDGQLRPWTLLTYALLHASWAHVGFNCVWLVAFGSAVARRFMAWRFIALLVVAAVAGALVQYAADITSFQLIIGASAAVSGAIGAAARFVFTSREGEGRLFDPRLINETFRQPALTLRETFTTRAAVLFVLFWFGSNLLFGLYPALSGISDQPVAWQAHTGGFLAGLLLFPLFDPKRRVTPMLREEQADGLALDPDDRSSTK